jgi:flagellar motor switch protein FliM
MIANSGFKDVKPFDFRQIHRLPLRIEKKLEEVDFKFAQGLVLLFRTIIGESKGEVLVSAHKAELEPINIEKGEEKFDFTFLIEPGQPGRFTCDRNLASHLLCFYLGYPDGGRISQMKLSKIEESALLQLVKDIVKELQNVWAKDLSIGGLTRGYGKGSDKDRLVVSRFSVKCGMTSGEVEIGYPFSLLDKVCTGDLISSMEYKQKIKELIEDSEVKLTCVLGKVETYSHASLQLTLNQISELRPGNVILMDKERDSEVTISIQEKNRFRGVPGIYNSRKGVKIIQTFS